MQPGWFKDPSDRFPLRWFDGSQWTPQVSTVGNARRRTHCRAVRTPPPQRLSPPTGLSQPPRLRQPLRLSH